MTLPTKTEVDMRISEIAELLGETSSTIRFYESRGLLADPGRAANGYREYMARAAEPIRQIRTLQRAGLSLVDISALQSIQHSPEDLTGDERRFVSGLEGQLDRRLEALLRTRSKLASMVEHPTCENEPG